jgi:hypothetical protein
LRAEAARFRHNICEGAVEGRIPGGGSVNRKDAGEVRVDAIAKREVHEGCAGHAATEIDLGHAVELAAAVL